jgi:hypothetical protein
VPDDDDAPIPITHLGYVDLPDGEDRRCVPARVALMWQALEAHGIRDTHGGDHETIGRRLMAGEAVYLVDPVEDLRPEVVARCLEGTDFTTPALRAPMVPTTHATFGVIRVVVPDDPAVVDAMARTFGGEAARFDDSQDFMAAGEVVGRVVVPNTGDVIADGVAAFGILTTLGMNIIRFRPGQDPRAAIRAAIRPGSEVFAVKVFDALTPEQRARALAGTLFAPVFSVAAPAGAMLS